MDARIQDVALSVEAQRLYMNYALSVISSRALPDVRDGLKPVQRRILFAMQHELHVGPDSKPVKCARIVGDVMGKYHPHGDSAVYDALVRLAQDWVLRAPLVRGQGNFGSLDGDAAAAQRYTEAKLSAIAMELLVELPKQTVSWRPNYDATRSEPTVLPARFPNLLVNGSQGIAVGMATSIPPHNLGEVIDALELLLDEPDSTVAKLLAKMKGPDFPTGGEILSSRAEMRQIYESGQGTLKLRGEWKTETKKGGVEQIILTSIPYGNEKRAVVEKIAEVIESKKLPGLVDVRDESTEEVRVVLELKKEVNADLVMAYLHKHTQLLSNVQVNLTCLVPSPANPDIPIPLRLDLKAILRHFLDFRYEVVTKRLQFELDELTERLHILQGFEKVFDALDEIIKIIRKSEDKQDAADKIMKRFGLDEIQTDAILELKLYRLARLQINIVRKEAEEKREASRALGSILRSKAKVWKIVKSELGEIKEKYGDKRRTRIITQEDAPEFTAEDFIVDEDALVIVSENGWVKRQGTVKDLSATRIKDGDRVLACVAGSTRATVCFFSSKGHAYVCRIADVPPSTGYGDPLQKLFKFDDGEVVVGAVSFDPRMIDMSDAEKTFKDGSPRGPYGLAVTRKGMALRFPLFPHKDASTRAGRKFARTKDDDAVLTVISPILENDKGFVLSAVTDGHASAVPVDEIALLSGAGKGTTLIKVAGDASLVWAKRTASPRTDPLVVRSESGRRFELFADSLQSPRGGKGKAVVKRAGFATVEHVLPEVPVLNPES